MARLLLSLPVLALVAGAVDTHLVRRQQAHRPVEPALFEQAVLIWLAFGLLALVPAWLTVRFVTRKTRARGDDPAWSVHTVALAGWMALPVLAHGVLDRYTALGQDYSELASARPWLEVLGLALLTALVGLVLVKPLGRVRPGLAAIGAGAAALLAGLLLPGHFDGEAPAPRAPATGPNVLLMVWDTARAPSLATYGYERETAPHLSDFASDALVYEEARSVSCFTLTSHLSMLTGTYPSHHGARLTRMTYDPHATPSITRLFAQAGYRTGGFVGTGVLRANTGMVDGFEVYDDRVDPHVCDTRAWKLVHDVQAVAAKLFPALAGNGNPHWIEDFQRPASEVLANALEWIQADDERPYFCLVNMYDVHWPYLPGAESRNRFVAPYDGGVDGYLFRSDAYERPAGVAEGSRLDDADRRHLRDLYEAEMWDLDREVDAFLGALDLGGTVVLVTSDHGEAFGEGGVYEHNDIKEPQVRVPFLLRLPETTGERTSGRVPGPVSGVDVAGTLLALAGLPIPEHMTGLDLSREAPGAERVVIVEDRDKLDPDETHYAVYKGGWKLVRTGVGETATLALFDLASDPDGTRDVAAEHPERRDALARLLDETRAAWGGDRETLDAGGPIGAHLKGLGYGGGGEDEDP